MNKLLEGKHIFISYIEENKDIAHVIWDKLDALGAMPWAYTKNDAASKWRKEIVRSIRDSDIMILVFSSKTDEDADRQIVREIGLASKNGLEIIPFMIDDIRNIKNEDLAYELEGINWIRNAKPIEKQIAKLLERIYRHYGIVSEDNNLPSSGKKYSEEEKSESMINKEDEPKKGSWLKRRLYFFLFLSGILLMGILALRYIPDEKNKVPFIDTGLAKVEKIPSEPNSTKSEKKVLKFNNREEIKTFLNSYYEAGESNSAIESSRYYTAEVEQFFKLKKIKKDKIIEDKIQYYKKFPVRKYDLVDFEIVDSDIKNGQSSILLFATVKWKVLTLDNHEKLGKTVHRIKLIGRDNKYLVKSIEMVDRVVKKDTARTESRLFVCYEKNIQNNGDIAYVGCTRKGNSCIENGLKSFGKYETIKDQNEALERCIGSTPRTLYNAEVFNLSKTKDGYLALREKPGAKLIEKLHNGEKLGILGKSGKWLKVKVKRTNKIGWVYGKWVLRK